MLFSNTSTGAIFQAMIILTNQTILNNNFSLEMGKETNDSNIGKCYGIYGCFTINPPWSTNTRQITLYPEDPSKLQIKFAVFTIQNIYDLPKFININEREKIDTLGINPYGNIYFIIHGFIDSSDKIWIKNMMEALISQDLEKTASVIVVDWRNGSNPPYAQAAANTRIVGAVTAHILFYLYSELKLMNLDKVHVIGHSLGSHISGYTGYVLQRDFGLKLGRITGLDPAEPLFGGTEPIVRLDMSDAKFVDVIHTDATPFIKGGLGMIKPIGHVDFYPNGGYNQPGCNSDFDEYVSQNNSFLEGVTHFLSCNHIRSYQIFTESVYSNCMFTAIMCDSYESFKLGTCSECDSEGHYCIQLGIRSIINYNDLLKKGIITSSETIVMYLMTLSSSPFCGIHNKITIKISSSEDSIIHGGEVGVVSIELQSNNSHKTDTMIFSNNPILFEPDHHYTSIIYGSDIGTNIDSANIMWEYRTNLLNPLTWRILSSPRLYIDYVHISSVEKPLEIKLCPKDNLPIVTGHDIIFRKEYCI